MKNPLSLLIVDDLHLSKDFYINVLGAKLVETLPNCLKLMVDSHAILMFQGTKTSIEYKHGYNANSTLVFTVDDLDEAINQLKSKNVEFIHSSPNQNHWGRYAAFKDPSGIVHELMELSL